MLNGDKQYGAFDIFKFIASILVVAIHIGPLLQVNTQIDFILTKSVARIAVPFFLMTTGFFALTFNEKDKQRVIHTIIKHCIMYGLAILIYLPINFYAGHFADFQKISIIKLFVFNGSFYHLWYFPAVIIGLLIVSRLRSVFSTRFALGVCLFLYGIGLLGDSYYGFIATNSGLVDLYDVGFTFFDYTRNGLFYTPLFLLLGSILRLQKSKISKTRSLCYFVVSLMFMMVEAIYLELNSMTRHNSMYIFLIPTMIFLFEYLKNIKMKNNMYLRKMSTWIYILHPLAIICIRGVSKKLHLTKLVVENNFILFISCLSLVILVAYVIVFFSMRNEFQSDRARTWIEISKSALEHNVKELSKKLPLGCQFMAVLKADAYGHGAIQIAKWLNRIGVHSFCVATLDEGIALRKAFIHGEILILGYTSLKRIREIKRYQLSQTVVDYDYAIELNDLNVKLKTHLAIDTGMNRLGVISSRKEEIIEILEMKNLNVQGIFTHLCCVEDLSKMSKEFTNMQLIRFEECIRCIQEKIGRIPKQHIQSSYGLLNSELNQVSYARIGIAMYGAMEQDTFNVKPVLSLKSRITAIKHLKAGDGVGYGQLFKTDRDMDIAVIAIGYADGLSRQLSCGKGKVVLHDHIVPIIGRICMDQCMVDISSLNDVKVMDEVILIGKSKSCEIHACELAKLSSTIVNETLVQLKSRVPRVFVD